MQPTAFPYQLSTINYQLKRCSRCLIPETHETIIFDAEGVCNVCRQHEIKHAIDWEQKKRNLDALIEQHRGKYAYDCIVPFSGGKDSAFTLLYLMQEYKIKPLVVSFDHGFLRPGVLANNERVLQTLGCDFLKFRPNWKLVQRLMLESFLRKGDFCWHCHSGIFAYPMQIAAKFEVPLVFWGEPSAEYTAYFSYDEVEEVDEKRFNRFVNLGITADDMAGMIDMSDLDPRDLDPFRYPKLRDLRAINYRSVCLGSYIPWNVKNQVDLIKRELGWQEDVVEGVPSQYGYEKIECGLQGVRDYIKFIKRGYGRTAHLASIDIRNGVLERETGERLMVEYDGQRPASLDWFLEIVGMSEAEFLKIAKSHQVSPWEYKPQLRVLQKAS